MEQFTKHSETLIQYATEYGILFLKAILVLIIGLKVISMISNVINRALEKKQVERSLRDFVITLTSLALKIGLLITVIGMVGIQTTSFVALLGAMGLAVGMSLQGALGNLAGGVLILFFKPFRLGDFIDAQGHAGVVNEIGTFCTTLTTPDNKTCILPNGALASGSIMNYSKQPIRRVDLTFGIGYGDDIKKAKDILMSIATAHPKVLKDPAPVTVVSSLGDSSVNFFLRPWVNSADYWDVYFDITEQVKLEFDKNGVSIPFPQTDVHLYQEQPVLLNGKYTTEEIQDQH